MQEKSTIFVIFSERLSLAIKNKGVKKKEFAEALGIRSTHLSRFLSGSHLPLSKDLLKMAKELNVSMEWLLGEESTTFGNLSSDAEYWKERALEAERKFANLKYKMAIFFEDEISESNNLNKQNSSSQKTG